MTGRVVWITGASSGIGAELARSFAARGAHVVVSARRIDRLRSLVEGLPHPDRHMILPLDVARTETHAAAFDAVLKRFGHVDTLVMNAGIGQRAAVREVDLSVERRIMDINFFGVLSLVHVCLEHLLERPDGHVVVVSSVMGKLSTPRRATYAASKHALHGWFDGLRAEIADSPVDITLLCPGYVRTEISEQSLTADGTPHGEMDAQHRNAMAVDVFARKAMRAIEKRAAEVYIGGPETWAVPLVRLFPGLVRRLLPRVMTRE
jgi:short-subunit dehydrogenase